MELIRGPARPEKSPTLSAVVSKDFVSRDYAQLLGEIGRLAPLGRMPTNAQEASVILSKVKYDMDVLKEQLSDTISTRGEGLKPTTRAITIAARNGSQYSGGLVQGMDQSEEDDEPGIVVKKHRATTRSAGPQLEVEAIKSKIIARTLRRWTHRTVYTAFGAWVEHAGSQRRRRRIIGKVVIRWTHRILSASFALWIARAKEQRRRRWTCERVVKRIMYGGACRALATWFARAKHSRKERHLLNRVLGRWMHKTASLALVSWRALAREQRRMSDVCAKLVLRWVRAILL